MNWNQPICEFCWKEKNPDREPAKLRDAETERCSSCGFDTNSGIYVRAHPDSVRYPKLEE